MTRPNTSRDDLNELLAHLSYRDIERAIEDYLEADDAVSWMHELGSRPSRRYFLIWQGEQLPAKAIGKAAMRANDFQDWRPDLQYWHTDPIIDALEHIGFAIWDEKRDGDFNSAAATAYETTRRLARAGQQRFRSEALRLWGNRCAISGVTLDTALEAAHIVPHTKGGEMDARNSIVLRVDLHRLFDAALLAIDPVTLRVAWHATAGASYPDFKDKTLSLPKGGASADDFKMRWARFKAV